MNKTEFATKVYRTFHRSALQLKKYSPEIFVVAGVVGTVASTIMACQATTKLSHILDETQSNIDAVHNSLEHPETLPEEYTEEDGKKDTVIIYAQTGVKLAKLYGPAIVVGAVSITAIISSHNILRKRNVALAAAYTTIDKGFKEYRARVIERLGADMDRELRYNIKAKQFEEVVADEQGQEKKVTKTVEVVDDPNHHSDYARFFDDGCIGWEKNPEYNLMFLKAQQTHATNLLRAQGYLFLNDVYDMLGIPRTKAGQMVGWIYNPENPIGDNFVDFGIYDTNRQNCRDFVNGYERTILLDFNVDGVILDLI